MARTPTRSNARRTGPGVAAAVAVAPMDVRVMNAAAATVVVALGLVAVAAGATWLMRSPLFPIRSVALEGELARSSVPVIRAHAVPLLTDNFFGLDLQQGRTAFEAVPWVRRAVVRRVWPDRLAVALEEHQPAALWEGPAGLGREAGDAGSAGERLVNTHGEVFEANLGEVEDDTLPRLAGPEGSAGRMLAVLQHLQRVWAPLGSDVDRLRLSHRGSWRAELHSGAVVELGRGSDDELMLRAERLVRTLPQVQARWDAPLQYADLRHADGYALRLRGVSTQAGSAAPNTANRPAPAAPARRRH